MPVFTADLQSAKLEVVIVSPYLGKTRVMKMLQILQGLIENGITLSVITRPADDYAITDRTRISHLIEMLAARGITVTLRPGFHQKFAVIDSRTSWYGSINLLSFGSAEESIMRLESRAISEELLKTVFEE